MAKDGHVVQIRSDGRYTRLIVDGTDFSDAFSFRVEQDAEEKDPFPRMTVTFPVLELDGVNYAYSEPSAQ